MASTQYIGARYVPLFYTNPNDNSNNWLSGVAYDPLTIVTDINQSYTSKIPVPASVGRPSENPTYWVMTGAYNAQIEQYHSEVESYITQLNNLDDVVNSLAPNRKFLLIGDSLAMGVSVMGGETITTRGWAGRMVDALGSDRAVFASVDGGGFTRPVPYQWLYQLQNADLGDITDDEITDIVVLGGSNDNQATVATVEAAIETFVTYARGRFKNLNRLAIGSLAEPKYTANVIARYKAKTLALGCEWISDLERLLCDGDLYDDTGTTHPSPDGYVFYSPYIIQAAITGRVEYEFKFKNALTVVFTGDVTNDNPAYAYYKITNNETVVMLNGDSENDLVSTYTIRFTRPSGSAWSYGSLVKIFEDHTNKCRFMGGDASAFTHSHGIYRLDVTNVCYPFEVAMIGQYLRPYPEFYLNPYMENTATLHFVMNTCSPMKLN